MSHTTHSLPSFPPISLQHHSNFVHLLTNTGARELHGSGVSASGESAGSSGARGVEHVSGKWRPTAPYAPRCAFWSLSLSLSVSLYLSLSLSLSLSLHKVSKKQSQAKDAKMLAILDKFIRNTHKERMHAYIYKHLCIVYHVHAYAMHAYQYTQLLCVRSINKAG